MEVRVEDDSSDVMTPSIEPDASHIINDNPDSLQEGLAQEAFHSEAGENSSERPQTKDRRRSVIWRHFERLESSEAAQCRICMRKLQCYDSGCTGNLHRHLSKRHPKVFSELGSNSLKQLSPDSNGLCGATESPLIKHELSGKSLFLLFKVFMVFNKTRFIYSELIFCTFCTSIWLSTASKHSKHLIIFGSKVIFFSSVWKMSCFIKLSNVKSQSQGIPPLT